MAQEIIIVAILVVLAGLAILDFSSFRHWLLYGVTKAETFLGSKTGKLKLEYVYNLALVKYPLITKLLPFTIFSKLVNISLTAMKSMLSESEEIKKIIDNKKLDENEK